MNAASSRLRVTGMMSRDMGAIWPGTLLVAYLVFTAVILLNGRERVGMFAIVAHLAAIVAMSATTWAPGIPAWLRAWAPLGLLLFLYSEMPAIIAAVGHGALYDPQVIAWEAALFGNQPARAWAAAWTNAAFSELVHVAYLLYYPLIFALPVVLYAQRRAAEFDAAVTVLITTFIVCFVCYAFFPVAGPRYLWPSAAPDGPARQLVLLLLESRSSQGTAFPSSHVAVAVTQSALAMSLFGVRGIWFGVVTLGIAAGAVYGGFHYAIDILAGIVVGLAVPLAARLLMRAFRPQTR